MSKSLIILCTCFCLARPVLAWNAEGHMVVAQIAYNHLDPEVKAKCDALLTNRVYHSSSINSNFVTAAVWADDIKNFTSAYSTWHYIDLAVNLADLNSTITNNFPPPSINVVWAIQQCIATLQNPSETDSNQAVALRFLIHFVGDIQQPLHCAEGHSSSSSSSGDGGGNGFSINGSWSNLHSLWDYGGGYLSDNVSSRYSASTQAILSNKAVASEAAYPYTLSVGSIPDPMAWAVEGWGLGKTVAYFGITNGTSPTASYLNTAQATTEQRMAIGGQRLAKLLNTIFVTNAPSLTSVTLTNGNSSFALSWGSVSGRTYRVQWKTQTGDPAWNDLTDITASTNSITFTDPVAPLQRFYRVIVVN